MLVIVLTGSASVLLLAMATALIMRAGAKPPTPIRTASRRSQEEYAFHHHATDLRRKGLMCLMAGVMTLGLCLTVGVWAVMAADR